MSYESWRISYQSSEQAARAAYAKVEELAARLAELEGQEPVGEVTHSDVRPDSDGMYRHEFLSSFRIGAQAELYACPVRAKNMTMKDRCFTVDEIGFISDNNFDFDAGMRVSGDFVGDEKKRYAEMIAAVLNTHAQPVNARLLDVATGKTPHLYEGRCPDYVNGPESRDPDCPACQAIASAEAAQIKPQAKGD